MKLNLFKSPHIWCTDGGETWTHSNDFIIVAIKIQRKTLQLPEPQRGAEQRPRSRSSTPKAESDASTPTLSPDDTTVKEGVFFPKDKDVKPKDGQPKREPDGRKGIKIPGSEIKFYPDTALAGLPQKDKEV